MALLLSPLTNKIHKVLIITSSGGGGLLQAANAKEQEVKGKNPSAIVVRRDVMTDLIWPFGKLCVAGWNKAQIKGNVRIQSNLGRSNRIADRLFWLHIFFFTLKLLFKEDIDQVIDTQVLGTSAIIKAIRFFNRRRKKQVYLEKVLVDLPTKKATHFFLAIKALKPVDRKHFKLITIPPMLEKGETEEDFWRVNCNLTVSELQYEDYYIRKSFSKYRNLDRKAETMALKTRYQTQEERRLIEETIRRGKNEFSSFGEERKEVEFIIPPSAFVCTILLGSQPASDATFNYVKKFIEIAKEKKGQNPSIYLFVYCANHQPKQQTLFQRVVDLVTSLADYPSSLTVIPMSFQNEDVIAPLFFRSDITCTRSGGQTAMELMSVARGQIWVHSEAKKEIGTLTNEELLAGIPCWESASAAYLQQARNAKIVTPDTFAPLVYDLLS